MGRGVLQIALILAALSLGGAQQPQTGGQTENRETAKIEQGSSRIADAISEIRPEKDHGCADDQDKRGSDLCAQWKAVDAARSAAKATWWAVFLSFAGTVCIALTFWEARQTSRRQLRAYVVFDRIECQADVRQGVFFSLTIRALVRNVGQTPAEVFDAYSDGWAVNVGLPFPKPNLVPKDDIALAVTIGNSVEPQPFASIDFTRDELIGVSQKKQRLFIFTIIRYRDIFRVVRESVRCTEFVIDGELAPSGKAPLKPDGPTEIRGHTVPNFGWST